MGKTPAFNEGESAGEPRPAAEFCPWSFLSCQVLCVWPGGSSCPKSSRVPEALAAHLAPSSVDGHVAAEAAFPQIGRVRPLLETPHPHWPRSWTPALRVTRGPRHWTRALTCPVLGLPVSGMELACVEEARCWAGMALGAPVLTALLPRCCPVQAPELTGCVLVQTVFWKAPSSHRRLLPKESPRRELRPAPRAPHSTA